jgi:hypothetical protein
VACTPESDCRQFTDGSPFPHWMPKTTRRHTDAGMINVIDSDRQPRTLTHTCSTRNVHNLQLSIQQSSQSSTADSNSPRAPKPNSHPEFADTHIHTPMEPQPGYSNRPLRSRETPTPTNPCRNTEPPRLRLSAHDHRDPSGRGDPHFEPRYGLTVTRYILS